VSAQRVAIGHKGLPQKCKRAAEVRWPQEPVLVAHSYNPSLWKDTFSKRGDVCRLAAAWSERIPDKPVCSVLPRNTVSRCQRPCPQVPAPRHLDSCLFTRGESQGSQFKVPSGSSITLNRNLKEGAQTHRGGWPIVFILHLH
jgi:hypothetical protein